MSGHDPASRQNGSGPIPAEEGANQGRPNPLAGPFAGTPGTGAAPLAFDRPAPEGAASCRRQGSKATMSQVLGEITWLMSQSPIHKRMFIEDLEWLVMTPALLQQFRLYYDSGDANNAPKPIGVVFWAEVDQEVARRLAEGVTKLRPQDWTSGRAAGAQGAQLWVVEVIAPFGGAEDMVRELKAAVFPGREVRYTRLGPQGKTVGVV